MRNAIFNILINRYKWEEWAKDTHLLDAFTGSGVISIEAFSRKLKQATLIESNTTFFNNVKKNIEKLNLIEKVNLINSDFFNVNFKKNEFSLVYLDPPYSMIILIRQ